MKKNLKPNSQFTKRLSLVLVISFILLQSLFLLPDGSYEDTLQNKAPNISNQNNTPNISTSNSFQNKISDISLNNTSQNNTDIDFQLNIDSLENQDNYELPPNNSNILTSQATSEFKALSSPPAPPVITWPIDEGEAGSITDFSGQAEAGSLIKITLNNESTPVYSDTTRANGFWDVLRVPLSPTGIDGLGKNLVRATATNGFGESGPTTINVYYNSVPSANFVFPTGGEKLNGTENVTINFSDTENDDPLYYSLYYSKGGNPWEFLDMDDIYYNPGIPGYPTKIYNWNTTTLSDGNDYVLIVDIQDDYGYPDPITTGNLIIDNSGPFPTINPPGSTPIANNYTFTGNADDTYSNVSLVQWRVDAGSWSSATITSGSGTPNVTYSFQISLPNGNYTFEVRATDELGNVTDPGSYATINVDVGTGSGIPASPSITNPINNTTTGNSKITVSGLAEAYSNVKLYVNSPSSGTPVAQVQASASSTYTFNNVSLTPGNNTLITTATNGYGTSTDSTTINIRYDNLAVSLNYPIVSPWQGTKSLSWSSTGIYSGSSTYDLDYSSNNGQSWTRLLNNSNDISYNWNTTAVSDGMYYKIRIIADDGYLTVTRSTPNFTINNNLPTINLYPLSPDPINDITPTFSGVAYAANSVSGVEYTLDNGMSWHQGSPKDGAFDSNYEPFTLTTYPLELDTYTIRVRSKDNLNCYTDPADYASDTFTTYDNPPQVSIITPKANDAWGKTHNISWTALDIDNNPLTYTIQYLRNGIAYTIISNLTATNYNWNTSEVYDGYYQIKVIANDGILNGEGNSQYFIIDHTAPSITIDEPSKNPTNETSITFTGSSSDNLSGVEYVEYQINNGQWYEAIIVSGYKSNSATYRFRHPFSLPEGENIIKVRATDRAENIGYSDEISIIIDTTSPMIGAGMIKDGVFILLPDIFGKTYTSIGTPLDFSVYIIGEPTIVKVKIGGRTFNLFYSKSTGLYIGQIILNFVGKYSLNVYTEDGVGNSKERELAQLEIGESGIVLDSKDRDPISGVKVTVYFFEESEKRWVVWDGKAYGQENPVITSENGRFSITLPAGKFYFTVEKDGYISYKSSEFSVEKTKILNNVIILKKDIRIVLPTNKLGLPSITVGSRQISGILLLVFLLFVFKTIRKPLINFLKGI